MIAGMDGPVTGLLLTVYAYQDFLKLDKSTREQITISFSIRHCNIFLKLICYAKLCHMFASIYAFARWECKCIKIKYGGNLL